MGKMPSARSVPISASATTWIGAVAAGRDDVDAVGYRLTRGPPGTLRVAWLEDLGIDAVALQERPQVVAPRCCR